jgi:16S rRNA (guanine1207-N2)-methyltransferase
MAASPSPLPYYEARQLSATLDGQQVRFISKQGIPNWDSISPAEILLAESVELDSAGQALLIGCGHGALAVVLAQHLAGGKLYVTDSSFIALSLVTQTLAVNPGLPVQMLEQIPLPHQAGVFDSVVLLLPKGRKLARRRLLEAYLLLHHGGRLFIAGANQEGIQPVIRDAEALFGEASILGYKKGNRVACLAKENKSRPLPEWVAEPGLAHAGWTVECGLPVLPWHEFEVEIRSTRLRFRTRPGLFSFDSIDEGSQLLLENLPDFSGARVLDFGCGWGAIGLFAARWGATHVDLIDADLDAVAAACENLALNEITNASVCPSDVLSAVTDRRYELIVSNPPFHVGKAVDFEIARTFLRHARQILQPKGKLVLVANRFIRYDRVLKEEFRKVSVLAETGKFHVLAGYM